jgi:hypothetical protein
MRVHSHITIQIGKHWLSAIYRINGTEWMPSREQERTYIKVRWQDEGELISRVLLRPVTGGIEVAARNGYESLVTIRHQGQIPTQALNVIQPGGYMVIDGADKSILFDSGDNLSLLLMGKLDKDQLALAANESVDISYALEAWNQLRDRATLTPLQLSLLGRLEQMRLKR